MRAFSTRLLDCSPFYQASTRIMGNSIRYAYRGRSSIYAVVVVTILSIMIVLQTTPTLIFGPIIPNASAAVPDFNIGAAGDWGCRTATKSTINNIVSKSTEVTIGL